MAIKGPKRTIGQKAARSGLSQDISREKAHGKRVAKAQKFVDELTTRGSKFARGGRGVPWLAKALGMFVPGGSIATSLLDVLAAGQNKKGQFNWNVPAWAKGTIYEDMLTGYGTGIEGQSEAARSNRWGTSQLLSALPLLTRGTSFISDKLGIDPSKFVGETVTGTLGEKGLGAKIPIPGAPLGKEAIASAKENLVDKMHDHLLNIDNPLLKNIPQQKLENMVESLAAKSTDTLKGNIFGRGKTLPLADIVSTASSSPALLDFILGDETEQITPKIPTAYKSTFRNPLSGRRRV